MKNFVGAKLLFSIAVLITVSKLLSILIQPVFADESQGVSVSAIIPPRVSDFQFNLLIANENPQENNIKFEIKYGAKQSAGMPTDTTLVASWSPEANYVLESANNAYGQKKPVVDVKKRTITWFIPSFAHGIVNQAVHFRLKPVSHSIDLNSRIFTVTTGMKNQYVSLPDQKLTMILPTFDSESKEIEQNSYLFSALKVSQL